MANNFAKIPDELKTLKQWVCWKGIVRPDGKIDKPPINPATGWSASVSDPSSWSSFDAAVHAAENNFESNGAGLLGGIGLVLTQYDDYVLIDLDDAKDDAELLARQTQIYNVFNSYTETSPSGRGAHITVKGHIAHNKRTRGVEIYGQGHYLTFTGNVVNGVAIADRQALLEDLWTNLDKNKRVGAIGANGAGNGVDNGSFHNVANVGYGLPQLADDLEIYNRALNAANGAVFSALWQGQWQELGHPSQSEADLALINILAFYTKNVEQVRRMFLLSGLGQRDKAKRGDYFGAMVKKAFDRDVGVEWTVNIAALRPGAIGASNEWSSGDTQRLGTSPGVGYHASEPIDAGRPFFRASDYVPSQDGGLDGELGAAVGTDLFQYTFPPGLVGDVARYIYDGAPYPITEIAIAGGLSLITSVAGRAYNIGGKGLNKYIIVVAPTGSGKAAMRTGIDRLCNHIKREAYGPGMGIDTGYYLALEKFRNVERFVSQNGLEKHFDGSPTVLYIVSEFGVDLNKMASNHASPQDTLMLGSYLKMYDLCGYDQMLGINARSDKSKNTETVYSPSLSMLCDTTGVEMWQNVPERMFTNGLLARFTVFEYTGPDVAYNEGGAYLLPSSNLIARFKDLTRIAFRLSQTSDFAQNVIHIKQSPEVVELARRFNVYCRQRMREDGDNEITRGQWSRVHMNVLKTAGGIAVGNNMFAPVIEVNDFIWARDIEAHSTIKLLQKVKRGEIGADNLETEQLAKMKAIIRDYYKLGFASFKGYGVTEQMFNCSPRVFPSTFLSRRLADVSCFKRDRLGANNATKRALSILLEQDFIRPMNSQQSLTFFQTTTKCFFITRLDDVF